MPGKKPAIWSKSASIWMQNPFSCMWFGHTIFSIWRLSGVSESPQKTRITYASMTCIEPRLMCKSHGKDKHVVLLSKQKQKPNNLSPMEIWLKQPFPTRSKYLSISLWLWISVCARSLSHGASDTDSTWSRSHESYENTHTHCRFTREPFLFEMFNYSLKTPGLNCIFNLLAVIIAVAIALHLFCSRLLSTHTLFVSLLVNFSVLLRI